MGKKLKKMGKKLICIAAVVSVISTISGGILGFFLSDVMMTPQIQNQIQSLRGETGLAVDNIQGNITDIRNRLSDNITDIRNRLSDADLDMTRLELDLISTDSSLRENISYLRANLSTTRDDLSDTQWQLDSVASTVSGLSLRIERTDQRLAQLEDILNFKWFKTLDELELWLAKDNTDQQPYVPSTHDCDDFALDLVVSAFRSGYKMETATLYLDYNLWYVKYWGDTWWKVPLAYSIFTSGKDYFMFGNHMCNLTFVESSGWVLIEPQDDQVYLLNTFEL